MNKGISTLLVGSLMLFSGFAAKSADQSVEESKGNTTQISGDSNVVKNTDSNDINSNKNLNSITINIQPIVREVLDRLPEANKELGERVTDIATQLVEASSTENNSELKDGIVAQLAELSLTPYRISSTPFIPPINKTQLMCDNTFKFAYRGDYRNGEEGIVFSVNNRSSGWLRPGATAGFKNGQKEVAVLYLEFNKEKKAPVLHYECNTKADS